ncbi:MAG: hypothetical protein PHI38_06820 [Sulfurimonas sp.]|uniref:hypothetical protein n=1 Tax=Sulfurimonas sp. TaxID=2022749 RepID=UPI0026062003|nr:hypothetical protein [Sulfurimonas sp.]MDD3476564.1 hypothetical protein [Sulfurimonas sp.]
MNGIKILPTKHFIERLGERAFDLSVIAKLHMELAKQPNARILEVSTGNATIVAEIKDNGVVKLITGWIGNRKNKMGMEK